jgi:cell fate (sporulation/competence/biofilm development) regulator YlbF (YheA/YmcA/DUF963 family)
MTAVEDTTTAIEEHLKTLCAAIAEDEDVVSAREDAEAFLADESAVSIYREAARLSHEFEGKHHSGEPITDADRTAFAAARSRAEANPLVVRFSEAQGVLQEVANLVNSYVTKTLEKGRVPTAKELSGGSCGSGCGCH